jgi:hypothetical protein
MVALEIVLEPEQHQALAEIAQLEGRSISDLVREIVGQHLAERDRGVQTQREIQAIQEEHGTYRGDLLDEVREEREQDVERVWGDKA